MKEILDEMTKEELIGWIKQSCLGRPKRSELLYIRWLRQSQQVLDETSKENRALDGVNFKERDNLAKRFNSTTNITEKLKLLDLMEPYDKAIMSHIERSQAIQRKSDKVDKLYEQIDVERAKERGLK